MPRPRPRAPSSDEPAQPVERIYGIAAALAVLATRPEDVLRIAYSPRARAALGPSLREAARQRIAYRELSDEEIGKMAGAVHHEGVCVLARPAGELSLGALAARAKPRGLIAALDGVDNPHNVGAVLRSAAFFGVKGLLIGEPKRRALPSSARRVAEGGAEHVPWQQVADLPAALRSLREHGLRVIGSDSGQGISLSELSWPQRCVIVLGAEDQGLSKQVRACCDDIVRIAGTGAVESLNVAVAAGVLFASYRG